LIGLHVEEIAKAFKTQKARGDNPRRSLQNAGKRGKRITALQQQETGEAP
jgi:hypothetical protein